MKGSAEERKESVTISLLINILRVPSEDTERFGFTCVRRPRVNMRS